MRRTPVGLLACTLLAATAGVGLTQPFADAAVTRPTVTCGASTAGYQHDAPTDLDGDGKSDLAVGVGGEVEPGGEIDIRWRYGASRTTITNADLGLAPDDDDDVGDSIAAIDINHDACTDLLVGLPDRTVDGVRFAGGIQVLLGDNSRHFHLGPLISRATPGVPGDLQGAERFGESIAVRQVGATPEVWVGASGSDVMQDGKTYVDAGELIKIPFNANGDMTVVPDADPSDQIITLNPIETGAEFGDATSVNPTVMTPANGQGSNATKAGGCVQFDSASTQLCGQLPHAYFGVGTAQLPPSNRHKGEIVIGAPGQTVAGAPSAGAVYVYNTVGGLPVGRPLVITENTPGVPGAPHRGDQFGSSVAAINARPKLGAFVAISAPRFDAVVRGRNRPNTGAVFVVKVNGGGRQSSLGDWAELAPGDPTPIDTGAGSSFGQSIRFAMRQRTNAVRWKLLVGAPSDIVNRNRVGSLTIFPLHSILRRNNHARLIAGAGTNQQVDRYGETLVNTDSDPRE